MFRKSSREQPPSRPEPTFMSRNQMGEYLKDLRTNRPQRPSGGGRSLPWLRPTTSRPEIQTQFSTPSETPPHLEIVNLPPRSSSALSIRKEDSDLTNNTQQPTRTARPLVRLPSSISTKGDVSGSPSEQEPPVDVPYIENGQRWMERQESRSISMALRDMDLKQEQNLHAAAQDEASELVWNHQNPGAPYRNPDAPKYKEHLRRGSHARAHSTDRAGPFERSSSQMSGMLQATDSTSSGEIGQSSSQSSRVPSDSSLKISPTKTSAVETEVKMEKDSTIQSNSSPKKPYSGLAQTVARDISTHRRTSSGSKRKASNGSGNAIFKNPNDQIYEEPEEDQKAKIADPRPPPLPLSMRRNPFARVKFAQQEKIERSNSEPILDVKKFNKYEIHKNPPSQSRNPGYTLNVSTPSRPNTPNDSNQDSAEESIRLKDGKEVRGDDIRAATSMKMKDRSSKLPTPAVVSDKPGRPIVSFDPNWKPKEVELQEEKSRPLPSEPNKKGPDLRLERPSPIPTKAATTTGLPTLGVFDIASRERAHSPPPAIHNDTMETSIVVPVINVDGPPQIPRINEPEPQVKPSFSHPQAPLARSNTTPIPVINVPDEPPQNPQRPLPSINISEESSPAIQRPSIPGINEPTRSQSSSRQRPLPTINAPSAPRPTNPSRPLPTISAPNRPPSKPSVTTRPLPQPSSSRPPPLRHAHTTSETMPPPRGSHWSPSPHRSTAQCAQCALPISGRIVSAAGQRFHPTCFQCHHCGEGLECVAFYPEPTDMRTQRLSRIRRRLAGEPIPNSSDPSAPDEVADGDESLRFYCHLDFHELFSPRCKSCHTPIEGEVVVACGANWHVGHFFCAQCGDPFDASTPFVEKEGYAWCVGCHCNRYSAKCRKCRKPVTEVVVKALGWEWHGECFVCTECGGEFEDGKYFLRGDSQDPVCMRCEARRLKA
ncbi:MAG: hypothetical protein M1820_002426 [Bogoriella megaspora]|nr:MAG: hypothetical protein M1820_002426 [Bogoriella megaspora]